MNQTTKRIVLLVALLFFAASNVWCLSTNIIQVKRLSKELERDWHAVADIRYNEWIAQSTDGGTTTREAFRRATIGIYQEERPNVDLFLAETMGKEVVGAAEMSSIEVRDALYNEDVHVLYVTDVVTDRKYRRRGIARIIMKELEDIATNENGAKYLVLNVAAENDSAIAFYQRLGYDNPSNELLSILNTTKLAENCGTEGQLILSKKIG